MKFLPTSFYLVIATVLFGTMTPSLQAQVEYNTAGSQIVENFNSLGSSTVPWASNSTLPGWYVYRTTAGKVVSLSVDNGSSGSSGPYNLGGVSDANRALGGQGGLTPGDVLIGFELKNTTGTDLTSFTLSYLGEVWRVGTTNNRTLSFSYQITSSPLANLNEGTWIPLSALDFNVNSVSGYSEIPINTALDGSSASYSSLISASVNGIAWGDDQYLYLRWNASNTNASARFGIDDVKFMAVPESGQMASALVFAAGMLWLSGRRRINR